VIGAAFCKHCGSGCKHCRSASFTGHAGRTRSIIEISEEVVIAATAAHAAPQWSDGATLLLTGLGATLLKQGLHAADSATQTLSTDAVESLFNRLVSLSEGRPVSQDALPSDVRFCAALLLLRECMHHLHFHQVVFAAG